MEQLTDGVQSVFRSLVTNGDWLTNETKARIDILPEYSLII